MTNPTQDQVLTASLKLIVEAFIDMGYEEGIIFGKVNLILQGFITPEGTFTEEYLKLAQQAIELRASQEFQRSLEVNTPAATIVLPAGVGGIRPL